MFRCRQELLVWALLLLLVPCSFAQPDNDHFENAEVLSGNHLRLPMYFLGATREAGEPAMLEGPTIWYRWSAPADGYLQLGAQGYIYPGVYLFEGTNVASLTHVPPFVAGVTKTHQVQGNRDYFLAVVSPGPNADGTFTPVILELDFATAPINDLFANGKVVAGDLVETNELSLGLTQQEGEPFPMMWWRWTAPADGRVNLQFTQMTAGDHINFYGEDSAGSPALLWQSPHAQTTGVIDVAAGQTYHIAVHSMTHERMGFRLQLERRLTAQGIHEGKIYRQGDAMEVTFGGVPEGEAITNLFVYVSSIGPILDTNAMVPLKVGYLSAGGFLELTATARAESGKRYYFPKTVFHVLSPQYFFGELPLLTGSVVELSANMEASAQNLSENIQWWRWISPSTGVIYGEHLAGPGLNWALFKGSDPAALQPVPNWTVEAGREYVIQASSIRSSGTYRFSILRVPPANDFFANATVLNTTSRWEPVLIGSATTDVGEAGTAPSVWYVFTAPSDGVITFGGGVNRFLTTTLYPITVAKDAAIEALVPMTPLDGAYQFAVEGGERYRMRLQQAFPGDGIPYSFFHFAPRIENDDIAAARVLAGDHVSFEVTLAGAGAENDEPLNGIGLLPQRSAWFEWTAPYDGFAAVRAPGVMIEGVPAVDIDVFEGGETLAPVAAELLEGEGRFFRAEQGTKYLLRFSDFSGLWINRVRGYLDLSPHSMVNEGSSNEVALEPVTLTLPDDMTNAAAMSVRYKVSEWHGGAFRWAQSQEVTNIIAAPFEYTFTNLVVGNHTIYAVVTNLDGTVSYLPPTELRMRPANDDFEGRIELVGRRAAHTGSTVNATIEEGEPAIGNPPADTSVWYTWTAPGVAPTTIRMAGENYLRVYEGDSFGNLQALPQVHQQQFTFTPAQGRTYQISVASLTTNPAPQHSTTFGLILEMAPLTLLKPVNSSVFDEGESIIVTISTPEEPASIVNTEFRFVNPGVPSQWYQTNAPGYLPTVAWPNLPPGTYTVTAAVKFNTGETVSRNAQFRVRPRNVTFDNATVLEEAMGYLRPTSLGADATSTRRVTNWFRFAAETNGHLVIATTNSSLFSPPIGALDFKASAGTETNASPVPHIGSVQRDAWIAVPVSAGTTYNLQFTVESGRSLPTLRYYVVPPAANDLFENAELISGNGAQVRATTRFATNQLNEPAHFGAATRTLWWKWESPAQPGYVVYSGRAKFYIGAELTNLTALPASFYSAAASTYYIATEGSTTQLESEWKFEFHASPSNDHFANSRLLEGRRVQFQADLQFATAEEGERAIHPPGYTLGRTVWFTWAPPFSGWTALRSQGGVFTATLFRGTALTNLTAVAQDASGAFMAQAGEPIHLSIDTFSSSPFALLEMTMMVPANNDDFANAVVLNGRAATANSWNFSATRESSEPRHDGQYGGRSVWFEWTAPADGPARVTIDGDISTNVVAVYRGNAVGALQVVASGTGARTNLVEFETVGGVSYRIAVDGAYGATGDFNIAVASLAPLPESRINQIELVNGKIRLELQDAAAGAQLQRSVDLRDWETVDTIEGSEVIEIEMPEGTSNAFFRIFIP